MPSNKARLAVGLDLGSTTTRVVICLLQEDSLRFLGHGEAPAQAWNRWRLAEQDALTESIRFALQEAESRAQVSAESGVVGVGGCVSGVNSRGLYEFGRKREIEPDDLRYAVELAARVRLEEDRQIVQICPQDFTLDGRAGYRNPKGILCARLEANVHVVTASTQEHEAIVSAMHQAHLGVEESIFEGIAAAYAAVVPEDRARGVAVVDIGAQSTQLAVYDGDALLLRDLHSGGRRSDDAGYFVDPEGQLRGRREFEAAVRVRGDGSGFGHFGNRHPNGGRARDARGAAKPDQRNSGGACGRDFRACVSGDPACGDGAIAARRNGVDGRRSNPAGHVRHCGAHVELPGTQRAGDGD